ncbi:hypothetical protein [Amycolatopsis sp. NPDC059657]|uniref:hypothetical protein n=1 Tax=Amycolatopsis sp. NPDC059657 TaxID=3346899 RepID=UPI00367253BE
MTLRGRATGVVPGLLASAVLLGCGAEPGAPAPSPSQTSAPLPATSPPAVITVTGTIIEGVEPGCLVLTTGSALYLLIGGARAALVPGRTATVRGRPRPGLATTCQQGVPFEVETGSAPS